MTEGSGTSAQTMGFITASRSADDVSSASAGRSASPSATSGTRVRIIQALPAGGGAALVVGWSGPGILRLSGLLEQALEEVVEVVAPVRRVVGVAVHVPDVRNALLLQVGVDALADANQPILAAGG